MQLFKVWSPTNHPTGSIWPKEFGVVLFGKLLNDKLLVKSRRISKAMPCCCSKMHVILCLCLNSSSDYGHSSSCDSCIVIYEKEAAGYNVLIQNNMTLLEQVTLKESDRSLTKSHNFPHSLHILQISQPFGIQLKCIRHTLETQDKYNYDLYRKLSW